MELSSKVVVAKVLSCFLLLSLTAHTAGYSDGPNDRVSVNMVLVKGGTFEMGDVYGDGWENEQPTHQVTLSNFYISKYEVTVGQYREFVGQTGYKTSAEAPDDSTARADIMAKFASGELSRQDLLELKGRLLEMSGAGYWDPVQHAWIGYDPQTNWRNPGIKQSDNDPVLAVSVVDAMHYCNWLSKMAGLPLAYNPETGEILDKDGNPTSDVTEVRGYRLPTEAEWEYAAREGGRKVRFGNGKDIANPSEISFCGDKGDYDYFEPGLCVAGTNPVGNHAPNDLGLYDMSGNAWEWVSDNYTEYPSEPSVDPYIINGDNHALRGGRWGGDAFEARVSHRSSWARNDRCNNSGFRVARSVN
ncbi:MAG: SUMF1/EgtB/PvdO family nonheme iron enzyme [Candidatus Zixiibacteriota bacterium]|nr:MAG: SUMF1/EgtB/PvdO family nonheme iron enzyme [candidate division Zixibacteria bacterium]